MKSKIVLLLIFTVLMSTMVVAQASCNDPDRQDLSIPSWQESIYEATTVTQILGDGTVQLWEDECKPWPGFGHYEVYEAVCRSDATAYLQATECPYGCANGACLSVENCIDNDFGVNHPLASSVDVILNDGSVITYTDGCNTNILGPQSRDYICDLTDAYGMTYDSLPCQYGCDGDVCAETAQSTCNDGVQNDNEEGVDCGGQNCPACGIANTEAIIKGTPREGPSDVAEDLLDIPFSKAAIDLSKEQRFAKGNLKLRKDRSGDKYLIIELEAKQRADGIRTVFFDDQLWEVRGKKLIRAEKKPDRIAKASLEQKEQIDIVRSDSREALTFVKPKRSFFRRLFTGRFTGAAIAEAEAQLKPIDSLADIDLNLKSADLGRKGARSFTSGKVVRLKETQDGKLYVVLEIKMNNQQKIKLEGYYWELQGDNLVRKARAVDKMAAGKERMEFGKAQLEKGKRGLLLRGSSSVGDDGPDGGQDDDDPQEPLNDDEEDRPIPIATKPRRGFLANIFGFSIKTLTGNFLGFF